MATEEGMPSSMVASRKTYAKRFLLPIGIGIVLSAAILGGLNYQWLKAQLSYRFSHHSTTVAVLGASTSIAPGIAAPSAPARTPDPSAPTEIIIPAINVKAPVVMDETSHVDWKEQLALRRGVLHYSDTAVPNTQNGNVVIFGHSSGVAWAPGNYKWIFTLLNKLHPGDQIEINYQGIPYIYEVTDSVVVKPTDFSILTQTPNPILTLVTCTPVGTSTNRLVVHAKLLTNIER